ncbi:hypothetical protein N9965_01210 [bacterium]|nr:hypothetical protein [bacterium]
MKCRSIDPEGASGVARKDDMRLIAPLRHFTPSLLKNLHPELRLRLEARGVDPANPHCQQKCAEVEKEPVPRS